MSAHDRIDPTERAHLFDRVGYTPPIYRYRPDEALTDLVRRYWLPVWSLPEGATSVQRVLQYPVCLIVISPTYARLVGVTTGLGRTELTGRGWAMGTMLQPAAGSMVLGGAVSRLTDTWVDLAEVSGWDGSALTAVVRDLMTAGPESETAHRAAIDALEDALRGLGPVDPEGLLVNRIVQHVEDDHDVLRVSQVSDQYGVSERALQRLTARRLGLGPKWLIQRRRLHEAAEALRDHRGVDLAGLAADLGYADQAHFTRDFRAVTGMTPGAFAAEPRPAHLPRSGDCLSRS